MRACKHITFYFLEQRLQYINRILQETDNYPWPTDVFIHTNQVINQSLLHKTKSEINIIVHDLSEIDPFKLTWLSRPLMKEQEQKNLYNIFIYTEDDILIPRAAIDYWIDNKDLVLKYNCNLGFLRIEIDSQGEEYVVDIHSPDCYPKQLSVFAIIEEKKFVINNVNTYTAFWIYDQNEFKRFVDSPFYDINNIKGHGIREASAIGLHNDRDPESKCYLNTLIPLTNLRVHEGCKVFHLPNNFVNDSTNFFSCMLFTELLILNQEDYKVPLSFYLRKIERLSNSNYLKSTQQAPLRSP